MDTGFSIIVGKMVPFIIFIFGLLIGVIITKIDEYNRSKYYTVKNTASEFTITLAKNHKFKPGDKIMVIK